MKTGTSFFVLFILIAFSGFLGLGQGALQPGPKKPRTLEDYTPRMLKEIEAVTSEADLGDKQERMLVQGDILPSRVTVIYTGSTRPIPELKKEVIRQWARLYAGAPEHYTKPYETEVLFEESEVKYWIAVQQRHLPLFSEQLKQGDSVDLYIIRFGKAKVVDVWESVLLIESLKYE